MKVINKCLSGLILIGLSSNLAQAEHKMTVENADKMMVMCDANKDGMISKDEHPKHHTDMFAKYDKNAAGMLSKEEHQMAAMDMHKMMMGDK